MSKEYTACSTNYGYHQEQDASEAAVKAYLDAKYDLGTPKTELRRLENAAMASMEYMVTSLVGKKIKKTNHEDLKQTAREKIARALNTFEYTKCASFTYWATLAVNRDVTVQSMKDERHSKYNVLIIDKDKEEDKVFEIISHQPNSLRIAMINEMLSSLNEDERIVLKAYFSDGFQFAATVYLNEVGKENIASNRLEAVKMLKDVLVKINDYI